MLINNINTFKETVKVNKSATWEAFAPFSQDAQQFYIEPYLGSALIAKMEAKEPEEKYTILLFHTRRALGPFIYMLAVHETSINFGDAGHTVPSGSNGSGIAPASDSKIAKAQDSAEFRGWQNLEYLLRFLEENTDDYPEWQQSQYIRNHKSKYFRTAVDFQELGMVDIEYSQLTFDKLLHLIRRIEASDILDLVPVEIENPFDSNIPNKEKRLVSYIQSYVSSKAAMLHTSQTTKQQRTNQQNAKPEYKPVIRPLYADLQDTGNYYAEQVDYWRAKIIELLAEEFCIDKSGKLDWNTANKKLFVDIG